METGTDSSGQAFRQGQRMYAMHHAGVHQKTEDVEKGLDFDRKLYVARRVFEQSNDDSYVASLSSRTIVYKGMFLVEQAASVLLRFAG